MNTICISFTFFPPPSLPPLTSPLLLSLLFPCPFSLSFVSLPSSFVSLPSSFVSLPSSFVSLPSSFVSLPSSFVSLLLLLSGFYGLKQLKSSTDLELPSVVAGGILAVIQWTTILILPLVQVRLVEPGDAYMYYRSYKYI